MAYALWELKQKDQEFKDKGQRNKGVFETVEFLFLSLCQIRFQVLLGMVAHTLNHSNWEAEAGRSLRV